MTFIALLLWALTPGKVLPAEPLRYTFGPESTVSYQVTHPIHGATGVSHRLTGMVALTPGPSPELVLPLRLVVPLASFDSGNRNRDRNMLDVMRAARYPEAILVVEAVKWSEKRAEGNGTSAEGTATGTVTLKGVTRPVTLPLSGSIRDGRLEVRSRFSILLSEFGIERPSLLFRAIDDKVELEVAGLASR